MASIFHIMMSFLVLFGSSGVPVSRHYCKGELKSIAFFVKAKKCHSDQAASHCPFHAPSPAKEGIDKQGCCDDEYDFLQVDEQDQRLVEGPPPITPVLVDLPPQLADYQAPHLRQRKSSHYENYRPPPLLTDPPREFQVFRL